MEGGGSGTAVYSGRTEEIFRYYRARRAGMIEALTTDVYNFFKLCDPGRRWGNYCGGSGCRVFLKKTKPYAVDGVHLHSLIAVIGLLATWLKGWHSILVVSI